MWHRKLKACIVSVVTFFLLVSCDIVVVTKIHDHETISVPTIWSDTHLIKGTLTVNAPLTIKACSTIKMESNARIDVRDNGTIIVIGKPSCKTKFTSAKTIPAAGDWEGIWVYGSASAGNAFEFVTFEYGGGDYGVLWVEDGADIRIDSSTFSHIKKAAVKIEDEVTLNSFVGNSFKSIGGNPVVTSGNIALSLSPVVTEDIAASVNRVVLNSRTVTKSGTWKNLGIPYELDGMDITATVTIEAGTTLMVNPDKHVEVADNGAIIMEGTAALPITVTSAKGSPAAGDWDYIGIYASASGNNRFSYVNFRYAGNGGYGAVWMAEGARASFEHCSFSDIAGIGLDIEEAKIGSFVGNSFARIDGYLIRTTANVVPSLSPVTVSGTLSEKNRIRIESTTATVGGTWKNLGVPYEVAGFNIHAPIVVEAGTTIMVSPGQNIDVAEGGSLILDGTADKRITVKSSKTSPASGDWDYIGIYSSSANNNRFTYADIMHGGSGGYGQLWVAEGAAITLEHTLFSDGDTCDIDAEEGALLTVTDTTYIACPE